ncbi:MAG: hypothetical protein EOP45_03015 [Sphingobacteriaceae bacterium]|nr:MAG: hypothetical protein EOP45_03015 [Sphingobacteriaceae bacterium]
MANKYLYKKLSGLISLLEKLTIEHVFIKIMLVALAFILFVSLQSLSLNNGSKSKNLSPKNTWGIQEFSLPGIVQFGEAVIPGTKNNFTLTINVKPDASMASVKPLIRLVKGATISLAIGQAITVDKLPVYKVMLPTGEVQNWTIKTVHEKPD